MAAHPECDVDKDFLARNVPASLQAGWRCGIELSDGLACGRPFREHRYAGSFLSFLHFALLSAFFRIFPPCFFSFFSCCDDNIFVVLFLVLFVCFVQAELLEVLLLVCIDRFFEELILFFFRAVMTTC